LLLLELQESRLQAVGGGGLGLRHSGGLKGEKKLQAFAGDGDDNAGDGEDTKTAVVAKLFEKAAHGAPMSERLRTMGP
jgi:hypothetical protein